VFYDILTYSWKSMTYLIEERWKALILDEEEAERIGSVLQNLESDFQKASGSLDRFTSLALTFCLVTKDAGVQ